MKIIILSGISGSGKSTFAAQVTGVKDICSADHWFERTGSYVFNPSELSKAHGQCLRNYIQNIQFYQQGRIPHDYTLIVDNTNTTVAELGPYVSIAQAYEVPYQIRVFRCNPEISATRNTHGVPLVSCKRMQDRLGDMLNNFPPHWNKPIVTEVP